ncbi:hypothetical protein CPB83DRAFT_485505 [Crepidotus variabilis]|uniref:DUF6699 domain-containing protein n=1 Tax=Crepidotus variabilis TaxID=179855 RepID=A0A9P6JV57_9AGAR|nr:hypothetical protein CPB83DRAFT_485505 [Crepidotus variabilis]
MAGPISPWSPGPSYGPVLSQTDLYLLKTELTLNPTLEGKNDAYQLQFHLVTGFTTGASRAQTGEIPGKDEPATHPRVSQLIVISRFSPWCTIVKNDHGVTIGNVCSAIYKEYTDNEIAEGEFGTLNPRMQEQVKRIAASNFQQLQQPSGGAWGYYPPSAPDRLRRVDWLRDRVYFEGLVKDDHYAKTRLGFMAPNIFVMELVA